MEKGKNSKKTFTRAMLNFFKSFVFATGIGMIFGIIFGMTINGAFDIIVDNIVAGKLLIPIIEIGFVVLGCILALRSIKEIKVLREKEEQNVMPNTVVGLFASIGIVILILIISIIFQSKTGITMSIGLMIPVLIWGVGVYFGYRNLKETIELINKKLDELNNNSNKKE